MNRKTAPCSPDQLRLGESAGFKRIELIRQLEATRKALGLTQAELAERIGVARMTVQRAEDIEESGPGLETFLLLALAMNLHPLLKAEENGEYPPLPQDLIHRGLSHARTRHDLQWRDRQREAAFATLWEEENEHQPVGVQAPVPSLIPGITQPQATAAATVIQWLGSGVGFDFLTRALKAAGYSIVDDRSKPQEKHPRKHFSPRSRT